MSEKNEKKRAVGPGPGSRLKTIRQGRGDEVGDRWSTGDVPAISSGSWD